jgi:hypothetical protein
LSVRGGWTRQVSAAPLPWLTCPAESQTSIQQIQRIRGIVDVVHPVSRIKHQTKERTGAGRRSRPLSIEQPWRSARLAELISVMKPSAPLTVRRWPSCATLKAQRRVQTAAGAERRARYPSALVRPSGREMTRNAVIEGIGDIELNEPARALLIVALHAATQGNSRGSEDERGRIGAFRESGAYDGERFEYRHLVRASLRLDYAPRCPGSRPALCAATVPFNTLVTKSFASSRALGGRHVPGPLMSEP